MYPIVKGVPRNNPAEYMRRRYTPISTVGMVIASAAATPSSPARKRGSTASRCAAGPTRTTRDGNSDSNSITP